MVICNPFATYSLLVDWNDDGDYSDLSENVTTDLLERVPISFFYGRDQRRALSPASPGELHFSVCNADLTYSPEITGGISANLLPGRNMLLQITPTAGIPVTGFSGRIDDIELHSDRSDQSVDFPCIDALQSFAETTITTTLHRGFRTGEAITKVLDAVGWPAAQRSIDPGATYMPYWWEDRASGLDAIQRLLRSEGPPSVFFIRGGIAVFEDRHHRITSSASISNQATFCVPLSINCTTASPCPTGSVGYTDPFSYEHGLKNVINKVVFAVPTRIPDSALSVVYSTDGVIDITDGQTIEVIAEASDPFLQAVPPALNIDYTLDFGSVTVSLSQTSGRSTLIKLTAVSGPARVVNLRLRAISIPVVSTVQITSSDVASINTYGEQSYPDDAPWVNAYDAQAVADIIVGTRAGRVPVIGIRIVNQNATHQDHIIDRTVSDRVHVRNDRLGIDRDFYIERIDQTIRSLGKVHSATYGCEQVVTQAPNVFRFDTTGSGFNQGAFALAGINDTANVFRFDGTVGHRFNEGVLAW
jgi:hypothetical protein